jgi:hypothetical protein
MMIVTTLAALRRPWTRLKSCEESTMPVMVVATIITTMSTILKMKKSVKSVAEAAVVTMEATKGIMAEVRRTLGAVNAVATVTIP